MIEIFLSYTPKTKKANQNKIDNNNYNQLKMKKLLLISVMVISAIFANAQWQQTNGPYGGSVTCLATCGTNIFSGTHNGLFLSTNNGSNWTAVSSGLTNHNIYCLAVSGTNIFAGTTSGVILFTDNGSNWTAVNNALTDY